MELKFKKKGVVKANGVTEKIYYCKDKDVWMVMHRYDEGDEGWEPVFFQSMGAMIKSIEKGLEMSL